jgi:PBSX family phage terminase large subunit
LSKATSQSVQMIGTFNPLPWQIEPWRDKSSVMLLTGSAGGGKSRLAAEKVHGYCKKYPGSTWLMLRKAREWTGRSIVPFFAQTVVGNDPAVRFSKSEGAFYYTNGSMVYSGGMMDDKQRESVRSIGGAGGLDGAWFEEANAFTRQDFEEIIGRVRHTAADWQQIILTTNPDSGIHWIYKDLIQNGGAACYYSSAEDNPNNSPAYRAALEKLTGVMRSRLVLGQWVQAEGAVYDEFDPAIHVIEREQCPEFVRRIRAIDFGYTNPFVCQWWGIDGDERMYLYREIYKTRQLVEDLAPRIIRLSEGENIEATVADHDAEDRATLERHGVHTLPAKKDVTVGIQVVQARLKVQPDGKPRLFVVRGALVEIDPLLEDAKKPTCTLDEFPAYSWPKAQDGKAIKEAPVKIDDHGMDDARYASMYFENPSVAVIRMGDSFV